ncbi:hypothetical protein NDU88_001969 [Pleurodeles waltl]|uniref:Secreted protein n=1 Tax=Pleurodeles waltl TaxID=8319 RepID=A0AAV7TJT3_PLEWA|nr:hypothetical protein NDU88_001969 [Pleurodeles waltl]
MKAAAPQPRLLRPALIVAVSSARLSLTRVRTSPSRVLTLFCVSHSAQQEKGEFRHPDSTEVTALLPRPLHPAQITAAPLSRPPLTATRLGPDSCCVQARLFPR